MNIRIPAWVIAASDAFCDWGNVPIINVNGFEIVRLDAIVAIGFVGAVGYYWLAGGWLLALKGGAVYVFFVIAAWFMRGRSEEESKENNS